MSMYINSFPIKFIKNNNLLENKIMNYSKNLIIENKELYIFENNNRINSEIIIKNGGCLRIIDDY